LAAAVYFFQALKENSDQKKWRLYFPLFLLFSFIFSFFFSPRIRAGWDKEAGIPINRLGRLLPAGF